MEKSMQYYRNETNGRTYEAVAESPDAFTITLEGVVIGRVWRQEQRWYGQLSDDPKKFSSRKRSHEVVIGLVASRHRVKRMLKQMGCNVELL